MIHTTGVTPMSQEDFALAMLLSSLTVVPSVEKQTMDGALQLNGTALATTTSQDPTIPAPQIPPAKPVTDREYQGLVDLLAEVEDFRVEDEFSGAAHTVVDRQLVEAGQIIGRYDAFLN